LREEDGCEDGLAREYGAVVVFGREETI